MEQTTTGQAYCELFGLTEPPFRLTPDPQFLFASKQHARAKAYMESTIWLADGFVVLTGEIGSGKTTLIECFLDELPEDVTLAVISQTQLSPVEFLQAVLVEFGFEPFKMAKVELLAMIKEFLVEQYTQEKRCCSSSTKHRTCRRKCSRRFVYFPASRRRKKKSCALFLPASPS